LWLRKEDATEGDYLQLKTEIEKATGLPISFEGIYRWIVFLPSKVHRNVPVLNRYYGVFKDGRIKERGIATRRRDTPPIIKQCLAETLRVLSEAENAKEFHDRLPAALEVVKRYVHLLRSGTVLLGGLAIRKQLSLNPNGYRRDVLHAIAARQLNAEGVQLEAGEPVEYIIVNSRGRLPNNRVSAIELVDPHRSRYDAEAYIGLLLSALESMLMPLGYEKANLLKCLNSSGLASSMTAQSG